jgi:hypothetical protein
MVTLADTPDIMGDWNEIDYNAVTAAWNGYSYSMTLGLITYNAEDFCENVYDSDAT